MLNKIDKRPFLLFRGPVESISGYGNHSRDLVNSLNDLNIFDIKIDSCPWGHTPLTALQENIQKNNWIKTNIVRGEVPTPDIYVQVTVPNEFMRLGKINIGITAGIETTVAPKNWIDGCNRMDLILTTSTFSKNVLTSTIYNEVDKQTNKLIKSHKIERPIEILFEGVDLEIYKKKSSEGKVSSLLDKIETEFCFLFVGHWLKGDLGQDRKDVGMLIKHFCEAFDGAEFKPGLILKTSGSNFSIKERERFRYRIMEICSSYTNPPPIYFLFGELSDAEMNNLYNHDKIKAMVSLTKGEGFGRPFLEFSFIGKPIITSNWSGHLDFLQKDKTLLLPGSLENVHESAVDDFILKEGKWFTADYRQFTGILRYFIGNYNKFLENAEQQRIINIDKFNMSEMTKKLNEIIKNYVVIQKKEKLILPELIEVD